MAPIALTHLSSNWKKLQKTLQTKPTRTASPESSKSAAKQRQDSLKRKRSGQVNGGQTNTSSKSVNGATRTSKPLPSRKRQKMEEPPSVGASKKHGDPKVLSRSVSMPTLRQPALLADPKAAAKSISVLEPHPDYPDIENDGLSTTALPGKYVALDCEMVGTGPEPDRDSALARVSVVNFHGHQVYDSYVQVKVQVTDYRTAVSGIEPRHIHKNVARSFKEVHNTLKALLDGRILVGHAVKNDLDALLLKHDKRYIRDTSKYSKFRDISAVPNRTPSLKHLVEKLLGVVIQVGSHSSVEDARATMALFRLEKEGFDTEVMNRYGSIRIETPKGEDEDADVGDGHVVRKKNNNRRKNKKKKH
ncbi:RNA exonuclease-like protein [Lophiotrema nucula]|uniref:RNA exonuclease 4 n=1 Tax=Lophiotrema nucula TaxID=690887 RepID=A0A6A5ZQG3_9PLEO|nr:RNA exonuclease-like protein [Lophiotrema nucula]